MSRPQLPMRAHNPLIPTILKGNPPPVKYQILNCQGKDILVGRLKIETNTESGHAFILRRFDTGAVSLTTMFRAAFPKATEGEEKAEIGWVKERYDLSGNNGSAKDTAVPRLAGTWVSPDVALELGQGYSLGKLINVVVEASPDPQGNYRRSGKSAGGTGTGGNANGTGSPAAANASSAVGGGGGATPSKAAKTPTGKPPSKTLPTPSPTSGNPPAKRRKESSPAPSASQSSKPPSRASPAPAAPSSKTTVRRSTRTKSPAPKPPSTSSATSRTPKRLARNQTVAAAVTPGSSELTVVDEESAMVEDGIAGSELREQDIKEQKTLIEVLQAERVAMKKAQAQAKAKAQANREEEEEAEGESEMDTSEDPTTTTKKREREDEDQPLQFEFKEPENGERVLATNNRAARLAPRTKSMVWGVAAFAVGMGAVTFLPNFF